MKHRTALHTVFVAAWLFAAGLSTVSASPQGPRDLPHPRLRPPVARPDAVVNGKTYAEWSAAWWQWALELPFVPGHPLTCDPFFDVTLGQSGNVWFLAGTFVTCQRTIAIPQGKWVFLPIVNAEASSLEAAPFFGCTAAELNAAAKDAIDIAQQAFCIIDDVALQFIDRYRFSSPLFTFTLPFPNILGLPAGTVSPCPYAPIARRHPGGGSPRPANPPMWGNGVSDGYWAMIGPLSLGQHMIHFGATLVHPKFGTFRYDTTYNVTVF